MLRLFRGLFRRKVPIRIRVDAAEMRLKNQRFLGKQKESERWEKRMRALVERWRALHAIEVPGTYRGAAIDLEEAIDDLTARREG